MNWLPLMASTLVAETAPAATPVSTRLPAVPAMLTSEPSVAAPTVMLRLVASWRTRPVVPLPMAVPRSLMSVLFWVVRPSMLLTAAPTLLTVLPPTV
ncbi:hypothetical protein [Variovorax sp. OV329]|uniref:hypothetical protein n=1 Tax=Variovorax sp. OV329 TaxID=1882825 RepID=UPI0011142FAC|nr:hypothetical protein [Variovorax sp. OV329]